MLYRRDPDLISGFMEAHTVRANTQAELGRFDVFQALDIAFAGFQVTGQRVENS